MKLYRVTMAVTVDVWANDPHGAMGLALTIASKMVIQSAVHDNGKLVPNPFMNARIESGTVREREWKEPGPVAEAMP